MAITAGGKRWAQRLEDPDSGQPFPRKRAYLLGLILYGNGFSAMMYVPKQWRRIGLALRLIVRICAGALPCVGFYHSRQR